MLTASNAGPTASSVLRIHNGRVLAQTYRRCRRSLATRPSPTSLKHSIYTSNATDPYFNITYEDWLFRHKDPNTPLLLLYRDAPCVVIGRYQNPFKEVNLPALSARLDTKLVRRHSGGGTVYHDLGNTNFSLHLPRNHFTRVETSGLVLRAVRALGIPDVSVNGRMLDGCKVAYVVRGWYVSGSAYKIISQRAYHHGTMLVSTRLDELGDLLRVDKPTMVTKGVPSVRSPVCNLQQYSTEINHEKFMGSMINEFRKLYNVHDEVCVVEDTKEIRSMDFIQKGISNLSSWDWTYGQTPDFTYTLQHSFSWGDLAIKIRAKHSIVLACEVVVENMSFTDADMVRARLALLKGRRYEFPEGIFQRAEVAGPEEEEMKRWLRTAML